MENPYAPPKVQEKPRPKILDLYDRIAKYQRRVFYGGLLVLVVGLLLPVRSGNMVLNIAALGGLAALAALLFTLPMTIWGFIKGYREGRSR